MTQKQIENFKPMHDRVLIKRRKADNKTTGGLYIPDQAIEKTMDAEVIKVGTGLIENGEVIPLVVKPGDIILFNKWSGEEIILDDEEFLLIQEHDIIGVIN